MLDKEKQEKKREREATLSERLPPLQLSGLSMQDLQALCKDLHHKIDVVDEERYDIEVKVNKNNTEIESLSQKIFELKGKMKRPALKRVKISADAMLGALLGAKVKESVDFKANLKTVKKEEEKKKSKISSSRRLGLKIRLLAVAAQMLQEENEQKLKEREVALAERVPPLNLSGLSLQELQDLCKDLHHKIDVVDEERYDIGLKVSKNDNEIENMNLKITEIQSKFKKPTLKRVKISAEAMLSVLLGAKHKESIDFKANLKTVKKEEEKKEEVTDWRKNVEAMSGMEGRKKLFDASGN
uniref:Troponin I4b, tandem duplicate 2 n=3 Tax=Pomacentridae TaxID=30863 RepID=A0AAQ5XYD9_AMPOC